MSKLEDIGEFGLINIIRQKIENSHLKNQLPMGFELLLGVGDDAAIWKPSKADYQVHTTDTLVEGIHFSRDTFAWQDVGWKLAAVNLSDIAAMGADPVSALITLGLATDLDVSMVDELYDGILECFSEYPTQIIGGDIVKSDQVFITMSILGQSNTFPLRRNAAQVGDVVAVTGNLGSSAAGLAILGSQDKDIFQDLVDVHLRPIPQITMGRLLLNSGIKCAIDISDGLLADLSKVGYESGVEIHIHAGCVPVSKRISETNWPDYMELVLSGGEDYQLAFTGEEELVRALLKNSAGAIIGEVKKGKPGHLKVLSEIGTEMHFDKTGWDHLSTQK